jgi:hypothetical protein
MALSFNGAQSLSVATSVVAFYPFTFNCWVNPSLFNPSGSFLMTVGSGNERWTTLLNANGTASIQSIHSGTSTVANTAPALSLSSWSMVTGVFASSTSRTIYLNGINASTDTTSSTPSITGGTYLATDPGVGRFLTGAIAYPAIWKTGLSSTNVSNLFAEQFNWTNSGAAFNWTNSGAAFNWTTIGTDSRAIQSASIASFTLFQGAPPFVDAVTGTTWTITGAPLVVADPFPPSSRVIITPGTVAATAVSTPRRVLRPFHATNRF